jgi:hypothetical protein
VSASATTSAVPSAPAAVLVTCQEALAKEPGTFQYACADDGIGLQDMHWTAWGVGRAAGYGTEWENLCQPNCADGKIGHYPVTVVLSGDAQVSGQSAVRYTTLTVTFTSPARPPYYGSGGQVTYPSTQTLPLWGLAK